VAEGKETIVVALSGGVDSAVAAAVLRDRGHSVIGIMLRLWGDEENRCCSAEAVDAARRVCYALDIPFYLVNVERIFEEVVVSPFCATYAEGRTPNPCVVCNEHIKFGALLGRALTLGADRLATGHYARVRELDGEYQLLRGVDEGKDQSYVLYRLGQKALRHVVWPLGTLRKSEVRALARRWDLPVVDRPESQEVCFTPAGGYASFLRSREPGAFRPGPIVDVEGQVLGRHRGLPHYTVGQRRGLGIAHSQALYVLRIDVESNTLVAGTRDDLNRRELMAGRAHFVSGRCPEGPTRSTVKVRYRARDASATLYPQTAQRVKVAFDSPQSAVAPGQSAVFYDGDIVLGGGIIETWAPPERRSTSTSCCRPQ
jgi:tRNA-specific 2-thiouridylase